MKILTACGGCRRQFDVTAVPVGSRFHCHCGEVVTVQAARPHDAAVTRCSSCGAARQGQAHQCTFCDSTFTLQERDLDTVCAECMTRTSGKGRFCHHCGVALVADAQTGAATDLKCPVCLEGSASLYSRRFDEVTLIECHSCAGMWLSHEAFDLVQTRSRGKARLWSPEALRAATERRSDGQPGPMYRRCPVCAQLMARRNHGKTSGVIIDVCPDHGAWFDADELARVLAWIEKGGEDHSRKVAAKEQAINDRLRAGPAPSSPLMSEAERDRSFLGAAVIETIFSIFR